MIIATIRIVTVPLHSFVKKHTNIVMITKMVITNDDDHSYDCDDDGINNDRTHLHRMMMMTMTIMMMTTATMMI